MCEIEHFVDPLNKKHSKFDRVKDIPLQLYPQSQQLSDKKETLWMTVGEAVARSIINNETLGYFLARTYLFLTRLGIPMEAIRFRQHLPNEMSHYASDCYDAEILTSYGWIECVGHADRACYDLTQHARVSGARMTVFESYETPQISQVEEIRPNKGLIGRTFKEDASAIFTKIQELNESGNITEFKGNRQVHINNKTITLTPEMVTFEMAERKVTGRTYVPGVIEPSFGIGRIMYALLEHAYTTRDNSDDNEARNYLRLPPVIAPIKCSILPLTKAEGHLVEPIAKMLTDAGITTKVDDSTNSIGRRYARTDEIGIPFAITIDTITEKDQTVTLRERDSMEQVRLLIKELPGIISGQISGKGSWRSLKGAIHMIETMKL